MNIATYNFCQGGTDDFNSPYRVLETLHPDILLGQELCPMDRYLQQSGKNWSDLGYRVAAWETVPTHQKWGSAIFVKEGITEPIAIPNALQGWVVGVKLRSPNLLHRGNVPLTIFSIHVPTKQDRAFASYSKYLSTRRNLPRIRPVPSAQPAAETCCIWAHCVL
jgi:hypothetical protein